MKPRNLDLLILGQPNSLQDSEADLIRVLPRSSRTLRGRVGHCFSEVGSPPQLRSDVSPRLQDARTNFNPRGRPSKRFQQISIL